ncbi:hypothetical protein BDV36DRAFT_269105 [Aspergillus pseudocaelatus]|uniref:RING-type domain-containing protein n=1 Tax=Aspergillus pseudocaelatus TaxID=1825620 RepID=A0ABQ6W7Y8_9EURO|nr:hypothetical protein BDV36DRAFT_269105 [Aspergillus pseudocaelatus]
MPSPYLRAQTTFLPHLSEIIQVYPEGERWCVGYAPSQGRRCHQSTNARNRQTAMYLLDEGTEDLYAGRDINDLLEALAPYTLCTRWHKYQAPELAAKWKRKVQRFLGSCVSPAPTQRTAGERQRTSPAAGSRRIVEVECSNLENWALVRIEGRGNLQTVRAAPTPSQETRVNGRATQTTNSTDRRRELSVSGAAVPTEERTNRTRAVAYNSQAGLQVASIAASNRGLSNIPTATIRATSNRALLGSGSRAALSSTTSSCSGDSTRRPIEGDCSICYESLKKARSGARHDAHHNTEDEEEQQEIFWCKAQCGVNYHATCIESWLKVSPKSTCPMCRRVWKA